MRCEVVRTQLSAFMDNALQKAAMAEVRAHIDRCRSCEETYAALFDADEFYSAVTNRDVPSEYRSSLRERLDESVASPKTN